MLKNRKKNQGFTIIEVLIVLAIAGLILLVVFLAVPALQRNSRNTQIRNDAANLAGYINDFAANNNGAFPAEVCYDEDTGVVSAVKTGDCASGARSEIGKIRASIGWTAGAPPATPATSHLYVNLNFRCNDTGDGLGSAANRSVAVIFYAETSGGQSPQCLES